MIHITISGKVAGVALLYEWFRKTGRCAIVPTYFASMQLADTPTTRCEFTVTRDASDIVFGQQTNRFGTNGECPPCRTDTPYAARLHRSANIPFGLRLFDLECPRGERLWGTADHERAFVLIHHGPARTEGCFTIGGGTLGFLSWHAQLQKLLTQSQCGNIQVWVEPREPIPPLTIPKHTIHLPR